MAQASNSDDDPRERAVSSEPCSTRPNPFDDSDLSSRKRRRTSASGASRSRSVETIHSFQGDHGSVTDAPAGDSELHANNDSAMKIDIDPAIPSTPEQRPADLALQSPSGPRSSRVTINVRTPSRHLDVIPSSPSESTSPIPAGRAAEADDVKVSVEESEADMVREDIALDTPVSSNSDASSPPVELVTVQIDDDDDEVDFGAVEPQVTILGGIHRSLVPDPSGDFPFRDITESYLETINRLSTYMITHETASHGVADWIDNYLLFAKTVSHAALIDSYREHREMWLAIPEMVNFMVCRRSCYPRAAIRDEIFRFYRSFAKLTALFIEVDLKSLRGWAEEQGRPPDLLSQFYVHMLGALTRKDEISFYSSPQYANLDDVFNFGLEVATILDEFQRYPTANGGSLALMKQLAQHVAALVPRHPKLSDNLAYLSVLTLNIVQYNARRLHNLNAQLVSLSRANIVRGYVFYKTVAEALENIVDKHVNHLSYDASSMLLASLTEIFYTCLSTDHIVPADGILQQISSQPAIANNLLVPDAVAYRWKFQIFAKLIMSSQMQLRVMAATCMCNDLVAFYRRFGETSEDPNPAFLTYIAEFLVRSGLVAYLLSAKCHPEVTTESSNIVGFLVVSHTYTKEHTDILWRTVTTTQDPRISDALIKMVSRITHLFPPDGLMYLCEKLREIPVESFSTTMREFCDQIFRHLLPKPGMYDKPIADSAPYDLCIRLIRQASVFGLQSPTAYLDIQQFAIQKLRDLLAVGTTVEGRRKIYLDCLGDIAQKTPSTVGSLWVLHLVIRPHTQREIQFLTSEHNLTTLLIEELEAAIPAARRAGFPAVLTGQRNAPRKELLFSVLFYEPSTIPKDLGPRLWHLLVGPGAACQEDRDVGWQLLNNSINRGQGAINPFASICFSEYMPTLSPECFCSGTHQFMRETILPLVDDAASIILDDEESGNHAGIEQLWRMILTAPEGTVENEGIRTLVSVYLESRSILLFPQHRARKVHLSLVNRCLQQMSTAATKLKSFSDGDSTREDESMVIVATDQQILEQKFLFIRSLSVLREFHLLHQVKSHFSAPDLRPIILDSPKDVEGESAELKYQSFDGDVQTDVKPLNIGRRNTAASLFASLREATGFDNYRIYYRGRPFVPQEHEICKSLEDLQIHNGIILVKRESDVPSSPTRARPGASRVEVEILGHFEELWEYLSMEEKLAREIYTFLVKLPVDEDMIEAIENPSASYESIFALGQPYKSMYAVHALRQYHIMQRSRFAAHAQDHEGDLDDIDSSYAKALTRIMSLVVSAISDPRFIIQCPSAELQIELGVGLVECLRSLLDSQLPMSAIQLLDALPLDRLLGITSATLSANTSDAATNDVSLCLQTIFDSCALSGIFMSAFCDHGEIPGLFENLLLHDPRGAVRNSTTRLILQRIGVGVITEPDPVMAKFRQFFWPFVSGLVGPAIARGSHSDELLDLCLRMFKTLRLSHSPILDVQQLLGDWGKLLVQYTTTEDLTQPDKIDQVGYGLIQLLHEILCGEYRPSQIEMLPSSGMAQKIFWKHLFPALLDSAPPTQPILSTDSRTALVEIIISLIGEDPTQLSWLLQGLDELVPLYPDDEGTESLITSDSRAIAKTCKEFYAYDLVQQFDRQKHIKSPCGYAGLRNLSNTCYFNSLLTQLFMNTGFRQFVLEASVQDLDYSQALLFQTQKLFAFMQGTIRRSVNPEDVIASVKTYEDTQIDIHNQMDVDEFYNLLFDRWEGQLLTSEEKRQFRSFYGGQLVQQVTSKECEHISERLEPFSAIQCDIKGKTSLEESLQAYVDGEIMEGDNKYKCSTCDRHVDAVKRACLKDIPDNLIFHLKRFDFNLRTLQRNKINDFFAFPTTIDMQPYTMEHLSGRGEDHPKDVFELVGVLVHSGTAESGHYYSYVRERPSSSTVPVWVEFNDENVGSWDPANMEASCFGGPDGRAHFDGMSYDKTYSAYMLFYQRSASVAKEQELLKLSGGTSPLRVKATPQLGRAIEVENNVILRRHCIYDPMHIHFVLKALGRLKAINQDKCSSDHAAETLAIAMALSHLDQVASRAKDLPDFFPLHKRILNMCQSCVHCSLAVYRYFYQYPEVLRMLVQRNPDPEVRLAAASLVIRVLQIIKARQPYQYGLPTPDASDESDDEEFRPSGTVLMGMMDIFRPLWDNFHQHLRSWPEVFSLMTSFVQMGREETATFLAQPYLRFLLIIIYADPALELPQQFARMLSAIARRAASRPPSYESMLDLLDELIGSMQFRPSEAGEFNGADNARSRLPGLSKDAPFCFTKTEVRILATNWERGQINIFFEKLIAINQNPSATYSIIANLMRYGRHMEERLFRTLRSCISSQVTQHVNLPYLRVAAHVFCRKSKRADMINNLITYICSQCMSLHNVEGKAFLEFQREVFGAPRENSGEDPEEILMASYQNLPEWVPGLLGYFDGSVSAETEAFLQEKVFKYGPSPAFEDTEEGRRRAEKIIETARNLGLKCLEYLGDNFVNGRGDVSTRLVAGLQRVIKESSRFFNAKDIGEDEGAREFFRLSQLTLEPLRRILVEDVDEDGSGMFYSDSSSVASSNTAC